MVGHGGCSAGSYLADPTSLIPSHCASVVATSTLRVSRCTLGFRQLFHFLTALPVITLVFQATWFWHQWRGRHYVTFLIKNDSWMFWKLQYTFTHKPVNSESETALKHHQMPPPTEGSGAYLCVTLNTTSCWMITTEFIKVQEFVLLVDTWSQ